MLSYVGGFGEERASPSSLGIHSPSIVVGSRELSI
jgi:hypothetical protein